MILFPAIDLKSGACVRLRQGDPERSTLYSNDPVAVARRWQEEGAEWLHVIDLDGAFERKPVNRQVIEAILDAVSIPIQVGGGIRSMETIRGYLEAGVARVILGSVALRDPGLLAEACTSYPRRVALGIDARAGRVAIEGWTETSDRDAIEVVSSFQDLALAAVIYTDIQRDGMQTGVNVEATERLLRHTHFPVVASGGVASIEDVQALLPLVPRGLLGVITGKAIYDGSLNLAEAIVWVRRHARENQG